jgi:serine/threonine-protein kinase
MAPEQLRGEEVTRQTDLYAAAVVLWETLTSERLFTADNDAALFGKVLEGVVAPASSLVAGLSPELDRVIFRALDRDPAQRFATARDMALALQEVGRPASATEVGEYAERILGVEVAQRARRAADPSDPLVGDDAPTLPLAPGHKPLLHVVRTETAPRALPAGLLAKSDAEPPGSSRPRSLRPPGSGEKTRTETVQRAMPFALPPDDGSGSTRALSATLPPPKKSLGAIALLAALAFGVGTVLAAVVWLPVSASDQPPAKLELGAAGVRDQVARVPRTGALPPEPTAQEIQLEDVPVDGERSADAPKRGSNRARPRTKTPKKRDCKSLYYTDSTGIRRVKVDCL